MRDRDGPKYWSDKKQEVFKGVEIRKTPTQLADILGTYVWVYSGDPEFGGDIEESDWKKKFLTRHNITLSAASQPVAPENVKGHITFGTLKVKFDGVRRVRKRWSSDEAASWKESYWEVLLTEDHEDNEWLDMRGNAVGAAVVLDDNGYPFLVFDWRHPPGGHSSWSGYYVGKRLVEGKRWQLTYEERDRLGIERSVAYVKEGSPTEEEDKDEDGGYHESEHEGDEEADSDLELEWEEDEDQDEDKDEDEEDEEDEEDVQSREDVVSEEVGEKRKASNGETGANKRRRA